MNAEASSRPGLGRAVLTLLAGGAAAQLLPLLLGPWIARLYAPEVMGLYTAITVWAGTLAVVLCGRYEFALPLAQTEAEAEGLLALSVRIAAFILMSMLLLSPLIRRVCGDTGFNFVLVLPLAALMAWVQLRVMWATRAQRFAAMSVSRMVQYGGVAVLQVLFGLWLYHGAGSEGWGPVAGVPASAGPQGAAGATWSAPMGEAADASLDARAVLFLLLAHAIALWAASVLLARPVPRQGWWRVMRWPADAPHLRELAHRHRDFPLLNAPHAFLGTLQDALAVALIIALTGEAAAGFWGLALRYLKAPAALVGQAVSQAVYPRLAQATLAEGRGLVRRLLLMLGALGLLGGGVLMALGPALFAFAFGERWREAGELARGLAPYIALHFVAAPLAVVTMAWQAQGWAFRLALVGQAVFVLALALGLHFGGLMGAAWAVSIAMLPYFGFYFWRLANWPDRGAWPPVQQA